MAGVSSSRSGVARALLSAALVATLATFTLAGPAGSAHAAVVGVGDSAALKAALLNPTTTIVKLTAPVAVTDQTLSISNSVTLDLNGMALTTRNITLGGGVTLTVQDASVPSSGTLTATVVSPTRLAGITTTGATLIIESGTVGATGGPRSAGIGGNEGNVSGITLIQGGTVTATGGEGAAGIGGGWAADGGVTTMSGGTTFAYAGAPVLGAAGAGIGGGGEGRGGTIAIEEGAHVTAGSNALGSAVGSGQYWGGIWSLRVAGSLTVNSVVILPSSAPIVVASTGVIAGTGALSGGAITNNGAITNTTIQGVTITVNNYLVTFDSNGSDATPTTQAVRVYAPTFAAGIRTIPAPVRTGETLTGWNTASDATGIAFDSSSVLTTSTTVYAMWAPASIIITPATATVTAGDASTFAVEGFDNHDESVGARTAQVTFTSDDTSDAITDNSIQFTKAGTHTITATSNDDSSVTATASVTVVAAAPSTIDLHLSDTTVDVGDTVTGTVTGADAYGNDLGDLTSTATFSSDQATDVVDGNSIRFPTASTHLITATIGSGASVVSAQQAITVNPAAVAPPGGTAPGGTAPGAPPGTPPPGGTPPGGTPPVTNPPGASLPGTTPPSTVAPTAAGPASDALAATGYTAAPVLLLAAMLMIVLGVGLQVAAARRRHEPLSFGR